MGVVVLKSQWPKSSRATWLRRRVSSMASVLVLEPNMHERWEVLEGLRKNTHTHTFATLITGTSIIALIQATLLDCMHSPLVRRGSLDMTLFRIWNIGIAACQLHKMFHISVVPFGFWEQLISDFHFVFAFAVSTLILCTRLALKCPKYGRDFGRLRRAALRTVTYGGAGYCLWTRMTLKQTLTWMEILSCWIQQCSSICLALTKRTGCSPHQRWKLLRREGHMLVAARGIQCAYLPMVHTLASNPWISLFHSRMFPTNSTSREKHIPL